LIKHSNDPKGVAVEEVVVAAVEGKVAVDQEDHQQHCHFHPML
jgi:hypothetical protein